MAREEFVEVYHTHSPIASQKVLDVLLVPAGVTAVVHDRNDAVFPGAGKLGGYYIAVLKEHREQAAALLLEAEQNGFLDPSEGERV